MVRQDISRPSDRSMLAARATLDRVLELVERGKLSATELRVLLALLDRGACLAELAEALDQRPDQISRAGRGLYNRGLIRWHHVGPRKQTRLEITSSGVTALRPLLTAAAAPESVRSLTPAAVAARRDARGFVGSRCGAIGH